MTVWRDRVLIAAVGFAALLPFLGQTRDIAAREIRHAEIAWEMAQRGDLVIPTLLGRVYFDKPPVMHAMIAGLYGIRGAPSLGLARIPSVVAAILGVLALYELALLLDDRRTALLAAFALLSVLGYQHMARTARPDMVLAAAILGSCLAATHAMRSPDASRRFAYFTLAGAAAGLAVVTKGPLGIGVPGLFVVVGVLLRPDLERPRMPECAAFALGMVAVGALWVVPAYLHDHGAYLQRVITQRDLRWRGDDVPHSNYWYLVNLPLGFLPLTLLLPLVVRDVRRHGWSVAASLSLALLLVLSLVPKKRLHYLLPTYPFLTLAVAEAVMRARARRWVVSVATAVVVVSIVAGPLYYGAAPLVRSDDPKLVTARRVLAAVDPDRPIVCLANLAEEIAFEGRRAGVSLVANVSALVREARRGGEGSYVVLPEPARRQVLAELEGRLALTEVLLSTVPGHGREHSWRVYRVGPVTA